jgi:hypothetical protein
MRRFVRPLVVALFVFLMAVTPLSALMSPGEFEIRFSPVGQGNPRWTAASHGFTVRLLDRTGLARGLALPPPHQGLSAPVTNNGADGRALVVRWDGSSCDDLANLTFERTGDGFVIHERTHEFGCFAGSGALHIVAIPLWAPVDAATVQLIADP